MNTIKSNNTLKYYNDKSKYGGIAAHQILYIDDTHDKEHRFFVLKYVIYKINKINVSYFVSIPHSTLIVLISL